MNKKHDKILVSDELNDEAIKLRIKVFVNEQGIAEKEELTGDDNLFKHYYLYVDDELVSYARARIIDNYYLVGRVVTKKEYRNLGYAKKLFSYIEEDATKDGVDSLKLHAQDVSIGFYEKIGYKITSPGYMEAGVPHHNMEKLIKR